MSVTSSLPIALDDLRAILRSARIGRAQLFGSYARGDATAQSDIDLLIDPEPGVSLFDILSLQQALEARAGVRVELVTSIREPFAPYIKPDLIDLEL